MELYAGIDLHSNNSVVSVLDEHDRTVFAKRLPNDLAAIIEALRSCVIWVRSCNHANASLQDLTQYCYPYLLNQ